MAVNLDTRLPLAAIGNPLNPAGVMQNARADAIQQKLDEMRMDYESRKRRREADTDRYMTEAIDAIRQGKPAQVTTDFRWNAPSQTGIPQAPYEVSAREVSPAVPGRQPTLEDMQAASIDAMFRAGDIQGAFEAMKQISATGQYGNSLAAAVDDQGNLVYVQPGGPSGARVIHGIRPPEGMTVVNAGNERVLIGGKTGREQGRIPVQVDPTAIYAQGAQARRQERGAQLDVMTEAQKEAIRLQNVGQMAEQKAKGEAKAERDIEVAAKVRSAEDAISELVPLRKALSKLPSPAALKVESAKAFFGMENPSIQAALGDVQRISGRMLEYINRLPGAATDKDREVFMASAGVLNDPNTPASRKIAAADSAIQSYQRLIQKYGKGQSQPQRQQVNILPPASQLPGKIATDNTTGIRYKSDGTKWVRIP